MLNTESFVKAAVRPNIFSRTNVGLRTIPTGWVKKSKLMTLRKYVNKSEKIQDEHEQIRTCSESV